MRYCKKAGSGYRLYSLSRFELSLSPDQLQRRGVYRCDVYGERYDDFYQARSAEPFFDDSGDVIVANYQVVDRSFDQVLLRIIEELHSECDARLSGLDKLYPKRESETWPYQVNEARSYKNDLNALTPFINSVIEGTEYTVTQYADLILERSDSWATLAGGIVGMRIRYEELFRGCRDIEALKVAIDAYRSEIKEN